MMEQQPVIHPLEPVFNPSSRVLLLGTMPSPRSRQEGFYYSHPQNRFWRVMAALFQVPVPVSVQQKREFILSKGIALWDVLQQCTISGASDASIREPKPNDISAILQKAPIQAVFTTGSKAFSLYTNLCQAKTGINAVLLPSTSAANCRFTLDELVERYRIIVNYLY